MDLIIVESPSKAKTIAKYLKGKYKVDASGGHVRDLPEKRLGVDIEHIRPVSQRAMRRLADVGTERAFFQSWVRREARTKRSGTGVGTMLDAETPLQPGEQFYFLDTFPGYVAGVSTKGGGPPGPVRKYALDEMMER